VAVPIKNPKRMSKPWCRKSNQRELAMKTAAKKGTADRRRRYSGGAAAWRRAAATEWVWAERRRWRVGSEGRARVSLVSSCWGRRWGESS
jgi:hypothetical protein